MAKPRDDKRIVQSAIAEHLAASGSADWGKLRQRFPGIPAATFWRWVSELKAKPSAEQLRAARTLLGATPGAAIPTGAALPAPVALTAVASGDRRTRAGIHFFLELQQLMDDARLLRAFALTPDGTKVRNPKVLVDSAKLRGNFLQLYLTALPLLYASDTTQRLYAAVIETVAACEPQVAGQITERLRALSEDAGFLT